MFGDREGRDDSRGGSDRKVRSDTALSSRLELTQIRQDSFSEDFAALQSLIAKLNDSFIHSRKSYESLAINARAYHDNAVVQVHRKAGELQKEVMRGQAKAEASVVVVSKTLMALREAMGRTKEEQDALLESCKNKDKGARDALIVSSQLLPSSVPCQADFTSPLGPSSVLSV
jgi:hypothetical protein